MEQKEWDHKEDEEMQQYMKEKTINENKRKSLMSIITEWKELSTKLKWLKTKEADLRRTVCKIVIGDTPMVNGRVTVKKQLEGFAVKAIQTLGYSVDKAALGVIWKELSPTEKACIKMVPELKIGEYKKLPEDSLLHEAIVTKHAMPTLEAEIQGE